MGSEFRRFVTATGYVTVAERPLDAADYPDADVVLAGAPDLAGIRSETRAASRNKPVGYFRTRGDPWQPPVAGEAKAVRVLIRAAANFMIDRAKLRERVILRILADSGPRLHEVLALTVGGLRRAGHPLTATVRSKGSGGREDGAHPRVSAG